MYIISTFLNTQLPLIWSKMLNFASDKIIKNMTTPISDNFETRIINELMLAQQSIKIAVAWFNSKNILDILCWKLRGGVNVEIILHYDDVNSGSESSLDFSEYKRLGGVLVWAKAEKSTMHVKFCLIDDRVLLHGSCNWTYRAFKKNDEVLNVTTEEAEMISSYHSTFLGLKEKYNSPVSSPKRTAYTTQNRIRKSPQKESATEVHNRLSIDERKQLFLQALQPFESKYNRDYLQTFSEYWLAENMGNLRFEVDENGDTMDAYGITPDYVRMKLENWQSKYDIILKEKQDSFVLNEIYKMYKLIDSEYEEKNIRINCRQINYRKIDEGVYFSSDRLFGKVLFDKGLFVKNYNEYDSFLQKKVHISLYCPIESIAEEENSDYSIFCLLYEANQALMRNIEHNSMTLASLDSQITYKAFCDKYGIKYGSKTNNDKTLKEKIKSIICPIKIEYYFGEINVICQRIANQKFLLKLNEVFGFRFMITKCKYSYTIKFKVPYKVLYTMDGTQFDFRDDSFENGTMNSIKLPTEYKDGQFYIDKIEEMLNRR